MSSFWIPVLAECDAELQAGKTPPRLANRAMALVELGRFPEALDAFGEANQLARQNPTIGDKSAPYLEWMGTVLWIMGHQAAGCELFRAAVDGVWYRTIAYTDGAGGVGPGLLLWFAGVSHHDENAISRSLEYLLRLSKRSRISQWPGPLASVVLSQRDIEDVLYDHFSTRELASAISMSSDDTHKSRKLAQLLFCWATKLRAEGDHRQSKALFAKCARLERAVLEEERCLAAAEIRASKTTVAR